MADRKYYFLEKWLLMISGIAFLLLIIPAWGQGFLWGGIFGIFLCLAVAKLPLSRDRVRTILRNSPAMALGLLVCSALAVNFYNTWLPSSNVTRVAQLLGMDRNVMLVGICVAGTIAAAPSAGAVLSYYLAAGREELKPRDAKVNGRIPAVWAVGILTCLYVLGISSLIRANFLYQDDFGRLAFGYKQWDYFSRYFSTAMATVVHMSDYLVDIAPLPQLLAMLIMAVSAVLTLCIVLERTQFSLLELAAMIPFALNPYFLECVSYRFDAPNMAASVLFGVLPLLYWKRHWVGYVFASMMGIVVVCTSYQAATGVFPILVILLTMRMLHRGESLKNAFFFCLKSVAGYGLGLVFFKLVIMRPAEAGYVNNQMPALAEMLPNILGNLKLYYDYIFSDFKFFWLLLIAAMAVMFLWATVSGSRQNRLAASVLSLLALVLMAGLCFGIYPMLANTLFAPRAMYGFAILLSILALTVAEKKAAAASMPALVLAWTFFVFSFQYGNVLNMQKEYTDFRINLVMQDIHDMEVFKTEEPVVVQLDGDIGISPIIENMPDEPRVLYRLLPNTFAGGSDWTQYGFYYYYDLPDNIIWDKETDLREQALPVLKETMYHTIYGNNDSVLICLR